MSEQFLATAFVKIEPNVRGFRSSLESQIKTAIRGTEKSGALTAKVRVTPDLRGFKAALNTQLRAIQGGFAAFKVPVTPVVGKAAAAGAAGGAGTGAAASGTAKLSDAQKRAKVTADLLTAAFRFNEQAANIMNVAMGRATFESNALAQSEVRLTGASAALQAVEKGLAAAIESGNQKAIARLASTRQLLLNTQQENAAVIQSASNEKILAGIRVKSAESINLANTALTRTLTLQAKETAFNEAAQAIKLQLAAIEKGIAAAIQTKNLALAEALTIEQAELALIQKKLLTEAELFAVMSREVTATTALKAARAELTTILKTEIKALTTLAEVKAAESALTKAVKTEEKATTAARAAGIGVINAESLALERQVAVQRSLLVAQRDAIKGAAAQATAQAAAARGAGATFLSLLKVRGATLAAGSEFLAGAAAVAIFAKAVGSAAALEQELNVFQATANATAEQMEKVSQTALELGADITLPAVSASDAAEAFTSLAKAGLDVQDSLDGARGTLQLATAAQIGNAEATELVASALNSFGLAGIEATRVADLLTGAANAAQGSISDMGIALQQSSAVARQAGLSLEDTVAFITLLAKNGIRGSDAGTSLRTAILRLISPTETANKELERLGITVFDLNGKLRPEAFAELEKALGKLDVQARNQILRKIFGQDAIRAAVIFGREGTAGLNSVREATQEVGLASKLAEARTKGFSGQIAALKNNAETLGIGLGKLAIGPLGAIVDTLNEATVGARDLGKAFLDLGESEQKGKGGGFLQGIRDTFKTTGGDAFREIRATVDIVKSGSGRNIFSDFAKFESARDRVKRLNRELLDTVTTVSGVARTIKGLSADEAIASLIGMRAEIIGSSEDAEVARAKIDKLVALLISLGRTPTIAEIRVLLGDRKFKSELDRLIREVSNTPFQLAVALGKEAAEGVKIEAQVLGVDAALLFIEKFRATMDPRVFAQIFKEAFGQAVPTPGVKPFPQDVLPDPAKGLSGKQILGRIAGFDAEKVRAELSGSTAQLIAVLQAEQAFLQAQLQRAVAKKQPGLRRQIESALLGVQDDLESIAQDRVDSAKDAADAIAKAQKEADENVIKSFTRREEDAGNKILKAEATETLKDDIKRNIELRAIFRKQIKASGEAIKDLETRRDFKRATRKKIIALTNEIKSDQRKQAQTQRQEVRDTADRAIRGIELDIELAEINENTGREVGLRRKLIKQLEDRIKLEKGNTNKIKELRNEIARQKQAIKEALEESEDRKDAFKGLLFSFLQTQQGFASNLLGNLIPTNATGLTGPGGPGGATSGGPGTFGPGNADAQFRVPSQIAEASAATGARLGVSTGQGNTQIDILNKILLQLQILTGTNRHPEARNQRVAGSASMDTHSAQ